ncbi:MAG: YraN family protein [Patescibacteria group bacterium]|nr:YraN family protein [Patescibacteria group bacterium]
MLNCVVKFIGKNNRDVGKRGEEMACNYLKNKNYQIIEKNFTCRWGEIDIIAKKDNKIVFIEVKTRVGDKKGKPYEAINYFKLKGLKRAINFYLLKKNLKNYKLSLEVISVILNENLSMREIKHFSEMSYYFQD